MTRDALGVIAAHLDDPIVGDAPASALLDHAFQLFLGRFQPGGSAPLDKFRDDQREIVCE